MDFCKQLFFHIEDAEDIDVPSSSSFMKDAGPKFVSIIANLSRRIEAVVEI